MTTRNRNGPPKEVGGLSRTTRTEPTDPNNTTSTHHSADIDSVSARCLACRRPLRIALSVSRHCGPKCWRKRYSQAAVAA
jgi:hypothetical protein